MNREELEIVFEMGTVYSSRDTSIGETRRASRENQAVLTGLHQTKHFVA